MSIEYLTAVWKDDYYTEKDKTKLLVALAIADCADGNGYAFPGVEYIAKKSRSTPRFVQIVCRELQDDGKLKIQAGKGRNGTNLYQLVGVKPDHPMKKSVSVKGVKPDRGEARSGRNGVAAEVALELTAELTPQITQTVRNHQEASGTAKNHLPAEDIKPARKDRASREEVEAYVLEQGLTRNDAAYRFDGWESNGWTANGKAVKDWKASIRTWKAGGYFPSQKNNPATAVQLAPTPAPRIPKETDEERHHRIHYTERVAAGLPPL